MSVCLNIDIFTTCLSGPWGSQKQALDSPKWNFRELLSCHVMLGTQPGTCRIALLLITAEPFLHSKPHPTHPQNQGINPSCLSLIRAINSHSYGMFWPTNHLGLLSKENVSFIFIQLRNCSAGDNRKDTFAVSRWNALASGRHIVARRHSHRLTMRAKDPWWRHWVIQFTVLGMTQSLCPR